MDDIESIKQLKARVLRTMDTKDWAAMPEVVTDDVVIDMSEAGGATVTGVISVTRVAREEPPC